MNVLTISKAIIRRKSDGKYLVLTSSKWEERPDRSQPPDLPGGMVEDGETAYEGCIREVKEEAGLAIAEQDLQLVHADTFQSNRDDASVTRLIFITEVQGDPEVIISWEHEAFTWLDLADLLACDMRDPYKDIFKYLNSVNVLI